MLAKLAPAPMATNIAGKAQHIKVELEANNDKKFEDLSFIVILLLFAGQSYFDHSLISFF